MGELPIRSWQLKGLLNPSKLSKLWKRCITRGLLILLPEKPDTSILLRSLASNITT